MLTRGLVILLPILSLASCGHEHVKDATTNADLVQRHRLHAYIRVSIAPDLPAFDITQRTCALYVALRSHAFDETPAFGREIDSDMMHWNMCPGGTMVACATVPTKNGETVQVGIPWPFAPPQQH